MRCSRSARSCRADAQAAVIGMLSGRAARGEPARSEATITGSQSGWARIALNTAPDYAAAGVTPQSFGWVPVDLLTVDARVERHDHGLRPLGSIGSGRRDHRRRRHEVPCARLPRLRAWGALRQIFNSLKKSLPLSSVTMKAGKFSTWMRQMASMPSSGYSSTSTFLMQFLARMAAGPPIEPR